MWKLRPSEGDDGETYDEWKGQSAKRIDDALKYKHHLGNSNLQRIPSRGSLSSVKHERPALPDSFPMAENDMWQMEDEMGTMDEVKVRRRGSPWSRIQVVENQEEDEMEEVVRKFQEQGVEEAREANVEAWIDEDVRRKEVWVLGKEDEARLHQMEEQAMRLAHEARNDEGAWKEEGVRRLKRLEEKAEDITRLKEVMEMLEMVTMSWEEEILRLEQEMLRLEQKMLRLEQQEETLRLKEEAITLKEETMRLHEEAMKAEEEERRLKEEKEPNHRDQEAQRLQELERREAEEELRQEAQRQRELRRREEERERNRRDQEAQRQQQLQEMERMLQDEEFIASLDPKVEEHARLLQEVQFRKREAEIKRRTEERKKRSDKQRESRRKQEKIEAEIRMRAASMPLSQEARMFLYHERLWHRIALPEEDSKKLTWSDIPWPVAMNPRSPEEISQHLVVAYMQSSFWAGNDSVKSAKKRIKESLRRWHPDRFDQICLARVIDSDKERVKLASGKVVRYLNELLRKEDGYYCT